ncbi:MAG: SDR family oxidoreductase [Planctomycetes bacterium]|nr:SDR family oxidoreductase [Planctomycetota bacterium]
MQLTGNTILITGGGSGIGRGLAEAFRELGNTVLIAGRDAAKLEQAVAANPGMHAVPLDVTDPDDIARIGGELPKQFPDLNVVINNAGVMRFEDVTDHDLEVAESTIATNLLGPIRLTAALLPQLRQRPRAAVLNVTSGLAFVPMAATPTYNATKAALHSYTISLREQLRDSSVEVLELIPPYVQTHLTGEAQSKDERAMPLADYIRDTMAFLRDQPEQPEVVIQRVSPLRHAEAKGSFDRVLPMMTEMGRALAGK